MEKRDLKDHIDDDDEEGVGEVVEEPDLHGLDDGSAGEVAGDREVDRGQDHHAGDIDADDQLVFVSVGDVVGGLVDNVHQNLKDLETKL